LALTNTKKEISIDYLFHMLTTLREKFEGSATHGGVFTNLTTSILKDFSVALPREAEQRAIAAALSDADALIASLDALIAKKRDLKQAAMQQLLTGKTRLPGFKGEWIETTVGDNSTAFAGGTPGTKVSSYWGGKIPWMSSGELHKKRIFDVAGRITDLGLSNSPAKWVPVNSVLVGLAGQGKTRGTVAISRMELTTNQSIAAIVPYVTVDAEFLYHNLDSRYDELRDLSSGDGGRGGLNLKILAALSLMLPPTVHEQAAIAAVLSDMDSDLATLDAKRDKARAIKQGMMQELLTGKIRLV
jgi:type I restriction enzyme S subunit